MKNTTEKFVENVIKGSNVAAKENLNKIIENKIQKRMREILVNK